MGGHLFGIHIQIEAIFIAIYFSSEQGLLYRLRGIMGTVQYPIPALGWLWRFEPQLTYRRFAEWKSLEAEVFIVIEPAAFDALYLTQRQRYFNGLQTRQMQVTMIEYLYYLSYNIYFSDIALDNQLLGVSVMHQLKAHTISQNNEAKA